MAGYIGSKSVLLSTSAANVTGDAEIGGNLTATGNFTSRGIDDNATSTAMTLDTSGNVLVGTTTPEIRGQSTIEGLAYRTGHSLDVATTSGLTANFNRMSTDGEIVRFRKNGTTVGSIGTINGDTYIGTGDTTLLFKDGNNAIYPRDATGATRDGAIDWGGASNRFKDLYLSGGVYLGGTGAANKLDDYEEGAFSPNFGGGSGNPTVTFTTNEGYYRKVGDLVFVQGRMTLSSASGGSGSLEIDGLPFTPVADAVLSVTRLQKLSIDVSASGPVGILVGPDFVYYTSNTTGNHSVLQVSHLTNTTSINFSGCYAVS